MPAGDVAAYIFQDELMRLALAAVVGIGGPSDFAPASKLPSLLSCHVRTHTSARNVPSPALGLSPDMAHRNRPTNRSKSKMLPEKARGNRPAYYSNSSLFITIHHYFITSWVLSLPLKTKQAYAR